MKIIDVSKHSIANNYNKSDPIFTALCLITDINTQFIVIFVLFRLSLN